MKAIKIKYFMEVQALQNNPFPWGYDFFNFRLFFRLENSTIRG
jgi:hypothetical protein